MEKFDLSKVLEGLDAKAHQSLQSMTIHYQIDALWSISELRAPRSARASKPLVFLTNRCSGKHFGAQGAQKHQSFQTISFHYQIDALQAISELKADPDPLLGACRRRLGPKTN